MTNFATQTDGRRLAWSELGAPSGPPVVWCHGGLSSRLDAELARSGAERAGVRLITIDRPGLGESARHKGRSVGDWAEDVAAVADAAGIERFHVVGWSAGGPHALAVAAGLPERVITVATIGGMAPVRNRHERKELGLRLDRLLIPLCHRAPWIASLMFRATRAKPERAKRMTIKPFSDADRRVLDPLPAATVVGGTQAASAHGTGGLVDDYRAFGAPGWGFALGGVAAPVTVWQGADDAAVPVAVAERLVASLPRVTLRTVPDAGHFLVVEHGAEVFADLLAAPA